MTATHGEASPWQYIRPKSKGLLTAPHGACMEFHPSSALHWQLIAQTENCKWASATDLSTVTAAERSNRCRMCCIFSSSTPVASSQLHQASISKVRHNGKGTPGMARAHHIAMLQKTPEGSRDLCFAGLADESAQRRFQAATQLQGLVAIYASRGLLCLAQPAQSSDSSYDPPGAHIHQAHFNMCWPS